MCSVTSVVVEPTVDEFEVALPILLSKLWDLWVFVFTDRFNPKGEGTIESIGSDVIGRNYISVV